MYLLGKNTSTLAYVRKKSYLCSRKERNTLSVLQANLITSKVFPAEREGFEPPNPFRSTVFKTAAIDHSAIFPSRFQYENNCKGTIII